MISHNPRVAIRRDKKKEKRIKSPSLNGGKDTYLPSRLLPETRSANVTPYPRELTRFNGEEVKRRRG